MLKKKINYNKLTTGWKVTAVVLRLQRHQLEMEQSCEFAKFQKVLASLVAITTAKDHDTAQDDHSRLLSGYSGAMLPPWLLASILQLAP